MKKIGWKLVVEKQSNILNQVDRFSVLKLGYTQNLFWVNHWTKKSQTIVQWKVFGWPNSDKMDRQYSKKLQNPSRKRQKSIKRNAKLISCSPIIDR